MSAIFEKNIPRSSYFKKKALDSLLKSKEKYLQKQRMSNSNITNYSTIVMLKNKTLNFNKSKQRKSLIKEQNPSIKLKFFSLSPKIAVNKFIGNEDGNKINNSKISNFIKKNAFSLIKENKLNNSASAPLFNYHKDEIKTNKINNKQKLVQTFSKTSIFKYKNNINNKYNYKAELEKEEEKRKDKICLINKDFEVKNFSLNPNQVIQYLNLNEKSDFFIPSSKNIHNFKKNISFFKKKKIVNRNNSANIEKRIDRINKIYPNVLNIEGHRNVKILNEINNEAKIKRKNDKPISIYYRNHFELKRRMFKERCKAEDFARKTMSDSNYKSQLLILSMKIYQRAIHYLEKKNSLKFNLDMPSYNIFLNLN